MNVSNYQAPARITTANNELRRVGIEVEMSGIELSMIACQINIAYGGQIHEHSPYEFEVETELGKMKLELDSSYLKKIEKDKFINALNINNTEPSEFSDFELYASDILSALAKNIVPCELVAPPLPIEQLHQLDRLIDSLRNHGAEGTRSSVIYAFGVHLNPELPNLEAETILHYLQAFLCLQEWLEKQDKVDYSRKLSPFINSFDNDYIRLVLDEDYRPNLTQLIDDYLQYNPTRNRILDMLPLFAFLDEDRVAATITDGKLNKRPTLHYRLPNSDIDNPEWGLWQCWNHWLQVEALVDNPEKLAQICQAYLKHEASLNLFKPWAETVTQWL